MIRRIGSLLLAALIVGCQPHAATTKDPHDHEGEKEEAHAEGALELTPEQIRIAGIETAPASRRTLQTELTVPGVVAPAPNAVAVVTPPVAGRIVRLLATVGDSIRKGQPLAVVQSSELALGTGAIAEAESRLKAAEAAAREAAAQVDLARSRVRSAEQALSRQRALAREGVFSQPSLQAAQNEVGEAQSELAAARSDLAGRENALGRAERLFAQGLAAGAEVDAARVDVRQAEIRRDRADARLRLAERTLERESRVGRAGLLNAREVQTAEAEVHTARLEVERERIALRAAQSAVDAARRGIAHARANAAALRGGGPGSGSTVTLTAPLSGVVTERSATVGQAVERSTDLFDIQNLDQVTVTANVPERDVARVRVGATVRVTTDAYPGRTLAGTVRTLGSRMDSKTRALPVHVLVPNPGGLLRPDGFAHVALGTGNATSTLTVPEASIVDAETAPAIFVAEDEHFERRPVKLGRRAGDQVEVLEGLQPGERVVVKGVFTLLSQERKGQLKGHEH